MGGTTCHSLGSTTTVWDTSGAELLKKIRKLVPKAISKAPATEVAKLDALLSSVSELKVKERDVDAPGYSKTEVNAYVHGHRISASYECDDSANLSTNSSSSSVLTSSIQQMPGLAKLLAVLDASDFALNGSTAFSDVYSLFSAWEDEHQAACNWRIVLLSFGKHRNSRLVAALSAKCTVPSARESQNFRLRVIDALSCR